MPFLLKIIIDMKKAVAIIILLVFVATPCFADFKFAVISDTQASDEDGINNGVLTAIMDKIKSEHVDFIMVTGDMVDGSTRTSEHIKQLRKWKVFMDGYNIPVYCIAGNHIIQSEMSENIFRAIFEMPENGLDGLKELVYSFDRGKAHFVGLDTDEYKSFHKIGDRQFNWLKSDLEKNKNKIIFIFGHDPAYPIKSHIRSSLDKFPSKRDELWTLFKNYNVKAYFCGHEHLYNKSLHDGIYQIIAGGGGGSLVEKPKTGGFHHFVIVNVKDTGSCEAIVKDINGSVKDAFNIEY